MKHPDDGRLQALMDGELSPQEARETGAHVEGCDDCGRRVEIMATRAAGVASALAALDPAPPTARVRPRVVREAELRRAAVAGRMAGATTQPASGAAGAPPLRRRTSRRWAGIPVEALPRAAVITLLLAGGAAAAALPGSPLRSWIAGDEEPVGATAGEEASVDAAPTADEVGVRVAPSEGRLRIVVEGLAAGAEVVVTRVPGAATAGVYAPDGARFRSGEGLLEVETSRGPVRVELPPEVVAVVSVGGRVYAESGVSGLRTPGPTVESGGDRALFRVP